jgi:hypothetical protein
MKRRLKTMKQLLEEFPEAKFLECGSLRMWHPHKGLSTIHPSQFHSFGTDVGVLSMFPDDFFEPLPPKRVALAYLDKATGDVLHVIPGTPTHTNCITCNQFEAMPEFDLIAKDPE